MESKPLVTIVIPTKNNKTYLEQCLKSIRSQTYKNIQVVVVDSHSIDGTLEVAPRRGAQIVLYSSATSKGHFEATAKRNFGAKKAKGEYVYYVDADMQLSSKVVSEAVKLCEHGADGVIVPEDSFGEGIWARAKNLERRCYWGDDTVEAPRFIRLSVWKKLGGLDEKIGGGGDDWDFYQKLLEKGYKVERTKSIVLHNEGHLSLMHLFRKRFMYGKDAIRYVVKRPKAGLASYFPIRMAYIRHWKLFLSRPVDTVAFIIMRTTEYIGGLLGALYSFAWR